MLRKKLNYRTRQQKMLLLALIVLLSGCDRVYRQMGSNEVGLVFSRLPVIVGGGLSQKIVRENQKVFLWPWEEIYPIERVQKSIIFGSTADVGQAASASPSQDALFTNMVYTRASDGTEVALRMAVTYQINTDPVTLLKLVQEVGASEAEVNELVATVARSDIRTHMSELETSEFANVERSESAVAKVRESMNQRLSQFGIDIVAVAQLGLQFERLRRDGTVDSRYQNALKAVRDLIEKTDTVKAAVNTIREEKLAELKREESSYNQKIQQAQGVKEQATIRGDNYYQIKQNEARALLAQGEAEVKGMVEQISALSGPGGQAILKLDLAKALLNSDPRFVLMSEGSGKGQVDVNRVDTNQLIQQIGLLEAMGPKTDSLKSKQTSSEVVAPMVPTTEKPNIVGTAASGTTATGQSN